MFYRRILYLGQFVAAIVLPTWVLIGRGLLDNDIGWEFLVFLVAAPFLSIGMLAVAGLTFARRSVRSSRAVSWLDAGLLTAWYLAIIAYGLWASSALAIVILLLAIGAFWLAIWQLIRETRERWRGLVAGFEEAAQAQNPNQQTTQAPRVIVITPDEDDPSR